jgi:hypothetical protein
MVAIVNFRFAQKHQSIRTRVSATLMAWHGCSKWPLKHGRAVDACRVQPGSIHGLTTYEPQCQERARDPLGPWRMQKSRTKVWLTAGLGLG